GKLRQDLRQFVVEYVLGDFARLKLFLVHLGRYTNRALPVEALNAVGSFCIFNLRYRMKRYPSTIRGSDPYTVHIAYRVTFVFRIAHHDPDLVLAALYALNFFAIKARSNLPGEVRQAEPQRLCFRLYVELDFRCASF